MISDTITDEVVLTNLIEKLPINIDAEIWANRAEKLFSQHERKDRYKEICNNNYDIHSSIKWLSDFYVKIHDNKSRS